MPGGRGLLALMVLGSAACSGAGGRPPPSPAADATAAPAKARVPYETPARWAVHPTPLSYSTAAMRLADGRCLVTEQTGQRWLTWPDRARAELELLLADEGETDLAGPTTPFTAAPPGGCAGTGRAAVDRAPEPLVGIVRLPRSYGFVGESGTLHEALSPLGKFTRRIPPPEPLLRVRGSGQTVLGLTRTGRLLRWDEEAGYREVDLGGAHAFDVAVAPTGHAVVLAAPEAVFTTTDGGLHFTRAAAPPIGAQRVGYPAGGPFLIEGVSTALAWDPREPSAFTKSSASIQEADVYIGIDAGQAPVAEYVTQGRAAIDGDTYWEASVDDEANWTLSKGKIDGRLTRIPVTLGYTADGNVILSVKGRHLAVVMIGWADDAPAVAARISHDGGATFEAAVPLVMSEQSPLGVAISADGTTLLTGACLQEEVAATDLGCPGGPLVARAGGAFAAPRGATPGGPAITPAFSPDGRSAYFLGPRELDGHLALFVSRDGGASFEERPLEVEGDGDATTFEAVTETVVTVSETGTVGVRLDGTGTYSGTVYLTANADGRQVRAADLPEGVDIVAGFGERVLAAMHRDDADTPAVPIWESLDGGATWSEVSGPEILRSTYRRRGDIACGAGGCLIGHEVTRVGWGGRTEAPLPFENVEAGSPPTGLRTPVVCAPRPGSEWTRVDHVATSHVLPDEHDAAWDRVAWMLPTHDPQTGAIGVVTATLPESGDADARVARKPLLGPARKGSTWATAVRPQVEGVAVARVELDASATTLGSAAWEGRRMKNLEIAWENLEEGSSTRAVLPDAGALQRSSIHLSQTGNSLALGALSISPKGIFVRASADEETAFFVDTSGKVKAFRSSRAPVELLDGITSAPNEAVHVDGSFVLTKSIGGDTPQEPRVLMLLRAPSGPAAPDAPWTPWAMTLAPGSNYAKWRLTWQDWTYEGGHLAVWTAHVVPEASYVAAWMQRVRSDGTLTPAARIPTPHDLPERPRPCSAAERASLPRLRMPIEVYGRTAFPGTRHPVLVTELPPADAPAGEAADPKLAARTAPPKPAPIGRAALVSSGYILRGTPASPCVDAIAARGTEDWNIGALVMGDLERAWFFRRAKPRPAAPPRAPRGAETTQARGTASDNRDIEVRPLTCRFDPTATVPTSVLETGARR